MRMNYLRRLTSHSVALLGVLIAMQISLPESCGQIYNGTYGYNTNYSSGFGDVRVGYNYTGPSTLTVNASVWSTGSTFVGQSGGAYSTGNPRYNQASTPSVGTLTLNSSQWYGGSANYLGVYNGDSGTENLNTNSYLRTGYASIGDSGIGAINVNSGSVAVVGEYGNQYGGYGTLMGFYSSGNGAVNVDGSGSTFYSHGNAAVGVNGTGSLNVSNGGQATIQSSNFVGSANTYSNSFGTPSTINGSVSVQSGGVIQATNNRLGYAANGSGTATVDGVGSKLLSTGYTDVGVYGSGVLTVRNGGLAESQTHTWLAAYSGSHATATVTGAGSALTSTTYNFVANQGTATLAILDGGTVSAFQNWVGRDATGDGSVTVDGNGSLLAATFANTIGGAGTGALTIQNGGGATANQNEFANAVGSNASATVTGAGSTLDAASTTYIGRSGAANVFVQNGGLLKSGVQNVLGSESQGNGSVTVDGAGSQMAAASYNIIGNLGTGSLTVQNGGTVTAGVNNFVGFQSGSSGTVTVTGAGSKLEAITNFVGNSGHGQLRVENGAVVTGSENIIGQEIGAWGFAVVDGVGSQLNASSGYLSLGNAGDGYLEVYHGGYASAGTTYLGYSDSGHGTIGLSGAGSTLHTGDLYIGGNESGAHGSGTVSLDQGAVLEVDGLTQIWATGTVNLFDGTLVNNGTFNNAGALVLGSHAVLSGSGVYNLDLTVENGTTLAPGNSPGTMTFNGNQTWGGGGNLALQLLNTSGVAGFDWDKIIINGDLTISATQANPFLINLSTLSNTTTNGLLAGFDPYSSYHWMFLTANSIFGFDPNAFSIDTAGFWNSFYGGSFRVHQDGNSLYLDYNAAQRPIDGTVTPEPTSLALAGFAGLGMAVGAWRRRRQEKPQAA